MALTILVTQCLQRDFVDPIQPYDVLPNRLHVGYAEALRLLGPDPSSGPIAQVMTWARSQPNNALQIIHIRDWHDPDDPRQRDHLARFGAHCIRDTQGAELAIDIPGDPALSPNEVLVDSIALNDFEGTCLAEHFTKLKRAHPDRIRVGVIGVWTEAKVSFLLYDLKTRWHIDELATCSALTASASRTQHFNALEQLNRILGVNCFNSVGEFISWLAPGSVALLPQAPRKFGHHMEMRGDGTKLSETDTDIVGYLYRDSSKVILDPLAGGFSGNIVCRALSEDALGHHQAPSVVKLGSIREIGSERVAFERVELILGNNAPSVRGFVELGERAGIKYSYAAMGQGDVHTLKAMLEDNCAHEKINVVLASVFDEILAPLYSAAKYERMPLLEHYGFSAAYAEPVGQNVERVIADRDGCNAIAADPGITPRLRFPGDYVADDIRNFYHDFLAKPLPQSNEFHYASYVHGDLNAANILIDRRENVWLIDFSHTERGHVLKDIAKLENDLLYILTPVKDSRELAEALLISQVLRKVQDLRQPLPEKVDGLVSPQFLRVWEILKTLRCIAGRLCHEDRHPLQMSVALLRFAVHTLTFKESSPLQKQWALGSACGFAEDIVRTLNAERALRVDWVDPMGSVLKVSGREIGRLGMTICPGRRDRGRNLAADLDVMAQEHVSRVLCLLTDSELEWAGVVALEEEALRRNFDFRRFPIPDGCAPELSDANEYVAWIYEGLNAGENVVVHCMGGLGRAGTIAACTLLSSGLSPEQAISAVRRARGPRAIETKLQENFISQYAARIANMGAVKRGTA